MDNEAAFNMSKAMLSSCNWESLNFGSLDFDMIEIDCLIHIYEPPDSPTNWSKCAPFIHVPPRKKWIQLQKPFLPSSRPLLAKQISDSAIATDNDSPPNAYVVFEITLNPNLILSKLAQLERDLALLLSRQRILLNDINLRISSLVSLCGLVTQEAKVQNMQSILETNFQILPLVTELWISRRLVVVKLSKSKQYLARKIGHLNSVSDSLGEIAQLKKEILELELKEAKTREEILEVELKEAKKKQMNIIFKSMDEFYKLLGEQLDNDQVEKVRLCFEENSIGLKQLHALNEERLKELGGLKLGFRLAILTVFGMV